MHHRLATLSVIISLAVPGPAAAQDDRAVDSLLARLTVRQKAAQLLMPFIPGTYAAFDDSVFVRAVRWVDSLEVGGLIVSIGAPTDIAAKLNYLQRRAPLPLLVAADLEGGSAFRFNGGTGFPTNMGVGAAGRDEDAYEMGRITAEEGRAVGIHITFSPVADVNNNPANPIINTRSFGGDPDAVARMVAAAVRGTQEHGVVATAKHFPGHGDTETDSHLTLPVVPADWSRLDSLELVPFRAAVNAGVGLVMSAHVAIPGVDSGRMRPATLVPEILTGILRDSLGFRGIIVTDALDMGGVTDSTSPGASAVRAIIAGTDILLQPSDPAVAIDAVVQAVEAGRLSESRLNASVRRVLQLKLGLRLFRDRTVNLDSVGYVVGRRAATSTARDVSRRALVLLRDSLHVLDRVAAEPRHIAVVTYAENGAGTLGGTLASELRSRGHTVSVFRLHPPSGPASYDSARAVLDSADIRIGVVSVRARAGTETLALPDSVAALMNAGRIGLLVSLGSPYVVQQAPDVPGYLLGWLANPTVERAVVEALAGESAISGRLPVAIPPHWALGAGTTRPARR